MSQIVLASPATAGNRVFACLAWYRSDSQDIAIDLDGNPFGPFEFGAGIDGVDFYTTQVFSLLVPSAGLDTITINSTGNSYYRWTVAEFSGVRPATPLDQTPVQTNTPSPGLATITSGALAQADELVVVCNTNDVDNGGVSGWAAPVGYTVLLSDMSRNAGPNGFAAFRNVNSTSPETATMQAPGSLNHGRMAMGTYRNQLAFDNLMLGFSM
jgi:hypothetical protein